MTRINLKRALELKRLRALYRTTGAYSQKWWQITDTIARLEGQEVYS